MPISGHQGDILKGNDRVVDLMGGLMPWPGTSGPYLDGLAWTIRCLSRSFHACCACPQCWACRPGWPWASPKEGSRVSRQRRRRRRSSLRRPSRPQRPQPAEPALLPCLWPTRTKHVSTCTTILLSIASKVQYARHTHSSKA